MAGGETPMDAFGTDPGRTPVAPPPGRIVGGGRGMAPGRTPPHGFEPDWGVWAQALRPTPQPPVARDGGRAGTARPLLIIAVAEIGVILAFYQWYSAARHWVAGSDAAALANALRLIDVEVAFGIFNEGAIQRRVLSMPWLVELLAAHYALLHFVVPVAALVVLFRRDRDRYYLYRRAFAWMSGMAVGCFALWPLLPPRLLPESFGFVDVLASVSRQPAIDHGFAPALYNPVAAMPSLHVGYALWSAAALWPVVTRRARIAAAVHVAATLAAVVVTGNHYHLDAAGAVAVLPAALFVANRVRFPRIAPAHVCAAAGLIGAGLVIWLPKGLYLLAAEDLLVAGAVSALALAARRPALGVARTG